MDSHPALREERGRGYEYLSLISGGGEVRDDWVGGGREPRGLGTPRLIGCGVTEEEL